MAFLFREGMVLVPAGPVNMESICIFDPVQRALVDLHFTCSVGFQVDDKLALTHGEADLLRGW